MISRFHNNVATLPAPPVRAYVPHLAMGVVLRPVPARFGPGRRLLNLSALCVDRHLGDHADRIAVLGHEAVSYRELHERVCRLANALKDQGVQRGDTVAITLPLGVDSIVAVLACIRIGAVHLVMAGGLDAHAMAARLVDCRAVAVLAGGETDHDTTTASLKSTLDRALATAGSRSGVRLVLVVAAPDMDVPMKPGRDHRYDAVVDWYEPDCPPEAMYADDPVFRLYRAGQSGSTCGATHTAGEYSRLLSYTMDMLSPQEDDGLPCSILNMAWQTGQTALVVGVLANGGTIALV